jgi:hypothetical protein
MLQFYISFISQNNQANKIGKNRVFTTTPTGANYANKITGAVKGGCFQRLPQERTKLIG